MTSANSDGWPPRRNLELVGRVAALQLAYEAGRRAAARRDGDPVDQQPLRDRLSSIIAEQAAHTVDERVLDLETVREQMQGSAERIDRARTRRTRYGR